MELKLTKKDTIIILVCAVFLLMNIGAIGSTGRRRAKEIVCLSNLHKWSSIFNMLANDNNGYFHSGAGGESQTSQYNWPTKLRGYYKDDKMRLCPMATIPESEGSRNPFAAWGKLNDGVYGSYGFNEWLRNEPSSVSNSENYWRYVIGIERSNIIPLFLDCYWYDVWPHSLDLPPVIDGSTVGLAGANEMRRVCLNRHNGAVNCLFLDFSARKVGLKELWTLKWHKKYNTMDIWTKAGGIRPEDWPDWMRNFKEF